MARLKPCPFKGNDRKKGKGKNGRQQVPRCVRNDNFFLKWSKKSKGKGKRRSRSPRDDSQKGKGKDKSKGDAKASEVDG
jgi:hypothetical protein